MKNFKKREYTDGISIKYYNVSKKHKANVVAHENQIPINWHEVKIILDATVVEKYLNNQKPSSESSPSQYKKILVQKMPRLNQHVFLEQNNVMVKLEILEDNGVDDNFSPADSLVFPAASVKQEDIPVQVSLDKDTFHDREFIESLNEDFQCQDRDNFTVEAALKNEVESECCYEETIIGQEFKDALKNEELFVGEEFKQEESVPSYENLESIDQEDNEEIIKKKTRSSRKKKKCLECIDCSHRLAKKPRPHLLNKVVPSKLSIQKPSKSKSSPRAKVQKTNQEPHHISSPAIPNPQKAIYRGFYCAHCSYKGRCREYLMKHLRRKHPYLISTKTCKKTGHHGMYHCDRCDYKGRRNNFIKHFRKNHIFNDLMQCPNCDMEFKSQEEMQRHRVVCLLFLICTICLIDRARKKAMMKHVKAKHSKMIYVEKGGKILDVVSRQSTKGVEKTLELTPFGQRYMEIRKYYLEIESELIKLYCPKCAVTNNKIISKIAPRCDICKSRMQFQCQKCKGTRNYYPYIWRHLTSKTGFCSISGHLPFMGHEESSNAIQNQASSIEPNCHACNICDFKGTTKKKLYEHVLNVHLDDGIMENGTADRVPCRFCPTTHFDTRNLSDHIASMHFDELAGGDINAFLQEALVFKKIIREVNLERFKNKLKNGTVEAARDYYHKGIESLLKPVCIECKTDGTRGSEHCAKCHASLNFVCLKCDELFSKFSVAWDHSIRMCENGNFTLTVRETPKHNKFDEFGRRIKRTFSENLKLATVYCPNCNEIVHKNFIFVADTNWCSKCNCKLRVYCQICNKDYTYWHQIVTHFQNAMCGVANIETYDMDHSYCLSQPLPEMAENSVDKASDVG